MRMRGFARGRVASAAAASALILMTAGAARIVAAQGTAHPAPTRPATDLQAAQMLAQAVQADLDLAQKASAHSSNADVTAIGDRVVSSQKPQLDAVRALERRLGGGPTSTPKTAPAMQQDPGPLENAVGAEFDHMFLERLARQLTDTQGLAKEIAGSGLGAEVKEAARKLSSEIDAELKAVAALRR